MKRNGAKILFAVALLAASRTFGANAVFRDNRVEFDGHAPYELLPDAGKEMTENQMPQNQKDAQP